MWISMLSWFLILSVLWVGVESECGGGCDALASYYIWETATLLNIAGRLSTTVDNILSYNPSITNRSLIFAGDRVNVPFSCGCINGEFLGHQFIYQATSGDTYQTIANHEYSNLTTVEMLTRFNSVPPERIQIGAQLNVTVNCSCGNSHVSRDYGLFITYPLRPGESLPAIANTLNLPETLLQEYNPGVDFSSGSGLVFVPGRDQNGTYPPLKTSSKDQNGTYPPLKTSPNGLPGGAIAGISIAVVAALAILALSAYFYFSRKKETEEPFLGNNQRDKNRSDHKKIQGIKIDLHVEFTYDELAEATDGFNNSHKIGQGGFGSVYYAELRGEKAAIKKMDMKASKEFQSELNVLTHVHHVNLVRLIGYCLEDSLCLVYEYVDNGNLSQHLRGRVTEPLLWSSRLQIALDSARGLEYIHEHTVPVYIHRDIKSANILIDTNFRAKVADFGLTKVLANVASGLTKSYLAGTIGYIAPEYLLLGEFTPRSDVYAFGVVLFELISAKGAIVKIDENETKGLVALFEEAFNQADKKEALRKLVDPRLNDDDDCALDSVYKGALLAKVCTNENPDFRPSMRSIVAALTALSSSPEDLDNRSLYQILGLPHQI